MNQEKIEEMYQFTPEQLTAFLNENSDKQVIPVNDFLADDYGTVEWFESMDFEPSYVSGDDLSTSDVEIDQPIGDIEINEQLSPMVLTDENRTEGTLIPVFQDNETKELLTLEQAAEKIEKQLETEYEYMAAVSPAVYSSYRENDDDGYKCRTASIEYDLVPEMKQQFESMQEFFQEEVKAMRQEQEQLQETPQIENEGYK